MASGAWHYREAERLLRDTVVESASDPGHDHYSVEDEDGGYDYAYLLAAQVHATLAQAAATIEAASSAGAAVGGYDPRPHPSWYEAFDAQEPTP